MKVKTPPYLKQKEPWRKEPFNPGTHGNKDPLLIKVESLVSSWSYNNPGTSRLSAATKQVLVRDIIKLIRGENTSSKTGDIIPCDNENHHPECQHWKK